MRDPICLDTRFSTTRLLTRERPVLRDGRDWKAHLFLPEGEDRRGEGGLRVEGYFKRSYKDKPCVTVITVVFNGERYIEQTIRSVLDQDYDNVEYIVIDGGSTDNTLAIIKDYEHAIDYWVSERDQGISDAMNKGIITSSGEIIAHLHSDDFYEPGALKRVVGYFLEASGCKWLIGEANFLDQRGRKRKRMVFPPKYSYRRLKRANFIPHPAVFLKREVFERVGLFDKGLRYVMDYEMWLRVGRSYEPIQTEDVLANFREVGRSSVEILKTWQEELLDPRVCNRGGVFSTLWNRLRYGKRKAMLPLILLKRRFQYLVDRP